MQHELAVQYHDHHAQEGKERTEELDVVDAGRLVYEAHQQRGEERAGAYDERGVGGGGEIHRLVLAQEIERAARDAEQCHLRFVLPCGGEEPTVVEDGHQHISHDEAQGEYLRRGESVQHQYLGGDERGAPYRHRDECYQMIKKLGVACLMIHAFVVLFCMQK